VPEDHTALLRRLVGGDATAEAEVLVRAADSTSAPLLVAAALVAHDRLLLVQAQRCAATTRDRQLVVLADALLAGRADLLDVLVKEHLAEHPDNVLAAWIAGQNDPPTN
jgi:hypothetical protein